ncbi:MAG TPA: methyltransferase domain-containing protein [Candidatus Polarisedimenticolaceae bacterium]|nr:methyltransferase domain-containing protein [Candidatus Polarisedimenticolaceae bacterium]
MTPLARLMVRGIDVVNRRGKAVGVRLVRLTGKRGYAIHPKHLVDHPWHFWYLPHLRPSDRVLDVGCGNGTFVVRAARECRRIVGMEYDPRNLTIAARMAREAGVTNAALLAQDITAPFPFRDRTFDVVLFLDVIEHIHPRVEVLREIHRVLADGGRLLVSAPNRDTRWRRTLRDAGLFAYSDPDHKIEYTRDEFVAELRAGGFEVEGELEPVVHDTPWAGAIDALGGVSLAAYDRLSRWRRQAALRQPGNSTGFRARAVKARR